MQGRQLKPNSRLRHDAFISDLLIRKDAPVTTAVADFFSDATEDNFLPVAQTGSSHNFFNERVNTHQFNPHFSVNRTPAGVAATGGSKRMQNIDSTTENVSRPRALSIFRAGTAK